MFFIFWWNILTWSFFHFRRYVLFLNNSSNLTRYDWPKTEDKSVGVGLLKHNFPSCLSASGHVITSKNGDREIKWLFPDLWMKTSNLTWLKHDLASNILLPCVAQWIQGGWENIWELWYQRQSQMGHYHTHICWIFILHSASTADSNRL